MTTYFTTCPAFLPFCGQERVEGVPLWSGASAPPALGDRVRVAINRMGYGTVTGYFEEEGFLGLMVRLDALPAYLVRQRRMDGKAPSDPVHVFGAELERP